MRRAVSAFKVARRLCGSSRLTIIKALDKALLLQGGPCPSQNKQSGGNINTLSLKEDLLEPILNKINLKSVE
jgi:hypothetical protein